MVNMSFHNGTLDKSKAEAFINESEKPLFYRHGFGFRGAEKYPINKQKAIDIIKTESLLDINEYEKEIVLNTYSSNDMW